MKKNTFNIIVPLNFNGERIDKFLQSELKELSRTRIQNLIKNGHVKLNNTYIDSPSKKVKKEVLITINLPEPEETTIKPNKIPLNVIYDDEDLLVINKNPGVVVHPGAGNYENTIVNGLLFKSEDEILKTDIKSLRNFADSTSNGVLKNSIPAFSQYFLSCSNSGFQNLSYFLKSLYWLSVFSFDKSQYACELTEAIVLALYV